MSVKIEFALLGPRLSPHTIDRRLVSLCFTHSTLAVAGRHGIRDACYSHFCFVCFSANPWERYVSNCATVIVPWSRLHDCITVPHTHLAADV